VTVAAWKGEKIERPVWVVGRDIAGDFGEVGLGCHFGIEIELVWVGLGWIGEMVSLEAGVFSCLVKLEMIVVVMIITGERLEVLLYISDRSPCFVREHELHRVGTCFDAMVYCKWRRVAITMEGLKVESKPSQDPSRGQCEGLKLASRDGDSPRNKVPRRSLPTDAPNPPARLEI